MYDVEAYNQAYGSSYIHLFYKYKRNNTNILMYKSGIESTESIIQKCPITENSVMYFDISLLWHFIEFSVRDRNVKFTKIFEIITIKI